MKKITLILLCSSAFLYACDSANDTANKKVDKKSPTAAVVAPAEVVVSDVTSEVVATPAEATASISAADGESIYKGKCSACHGAGIAGAPKLGDKAAWAPRIAQGNAVLTQHAITGFKGKTGVMPAKGGFVSLSDEEIASVVEYMVLQSK